MAACCSFPFVTELTSASADREEGPEVKTPLRGGHVRAVQGEQFRRISPRPR